MQNQLNKIDNSSDKIKLSICIPTLNRASFLAETFENVISQANNNIEIVIVDGASTDNTTEVVQRFNEKFANIVYYRGEKNMGVDRDMARTIELARGDYCWMLSDDDMIKPGAINRILKEIELGYEIYLCNVTACSLTMKPRYNRYWLSGVGKDRVFNLHDKGEFIEYCNKANSIGALFSYMSSLVIRREEWNKTGFHDDFNETAYALASSLLSFIKGRCRLKYIRTSLVLWRNDNETFADAGGLVERFLLDFDGYLKLADKYLANDQDMRTSFLAVMTREHPWYTIINVTSFIDNPESWRQFKSKMLSFGYNPRMVTICFALARYKNLVSIAVKIKRKLVRSGFYRWLKGITEALLHNNI